MNRILNSPPERSEILGGYNNVIHYVKFDEGIQMHNYKENHHGLDVEYINRRVGDWNKSRFSFTEYFLLIFMVCLDCQ